QRQGSCCREVGLMSGGGGPAIINDTCVLQTISSDVTAETGYDLLDLSSAQERYQSSHLLRSDPSGLKKISEWKQLLEVELHTLRNSFSARSGSRSLPC